VGAGESCGVRESRRRRRFASCGREIPLQVQICHLAGEAFGVCSREIAKHDDAESLLRKPQELSAITEQRAAMFDSRQTAVIAQIKTHGVVNLVAIVQNTVAFEFFQQASFAEFVGIEIPVPKEQVAEVAHKAATSDKVVRSGPID